MYSKPGLFAAESRISLWPNSSPANQNPAPDDRALVGFHSYDRCIDIFDRENLPWIAPYTNHRKLFQRIIHTNKRVQLAISFVFCSIDLAFCTNEICVISRWFSKKALALEYRTEIARAISERYRKSVGNIGIPSWDKCCCCTRDYVVFCCFCSAALGVRFLAVLFWRKKAIQSAINQAV